MATTRGASLAPRANDLGSVTLTTPPNASGVIALLSDRKTIISAAGNIIYTSPDYGVTQVAGKNFNDNTWAVRGFVEIGNGEVLVSVSKTTSPGELWRSTGWNPATANATSWAKVLTCSGPNVYLRGLWGITARAIAPSWSKHAGMLFVTEYGPQTDSATTPDQAAIRTYRSSDSGATWTQILDVRSLYPTDVHLHMHSVAYDPWDARLWISHGDGGTAAAGHGGIWYTDNPEDASPTWTAVTSLQGTDGYRQATTLGAFEAGLLILPDGGPFATRLLPRRSFRRYGEPIDTTILPSSSGVYIGASMARKGGLENPSPGSPILTCLIEPSASSAQPALYASVDGVTFKELYRHSSGVSGTAPGFDFVSGPTIDGKIVANLNLSGTSQVFTADYQPPAVAPAGKRHTVINFMQPEAAHSTWNTFVQRSDAHLGATRDSSNTQNSMVQFYADLDPGTYSIALLHYLASNRGIYTINIDGVDVGTIDGYAAGASSARGVLTGITVAARGSVLVTVTMATKNASSTGYIGSAGGLLLTRTSA